MDSISGNEQIIAEQLVLIHQQKETIEELKERLGAQHLKESSLTNEIQATIKSLQSDVKKCETEEMKVMQMKLHETLQENKLLHQKIHLLSANNEIHFPASSLSTDRKTTEETMEILEREIERLRNSLLEKEVQLERLMDEKNSQGEKLSFMEATQSKAQESFNQLSREHQKLLTEYEVSQVELQRQIKEKEKLEQSLDGVKKRILESESQIKESMKIAEDALMEKDASLLREKHAQDETTTLQEKITIFLEEASQKTRREVDETSRSYQQRINDLSEEVVAMETEINLKNLDFDRISVEKNKIISENEILHEEIHKIRIDNNLKYSEWQERTKSLEKLLIQEKNIKERLVKQSNLYKSQFDQCVNEYLNRISYLEKKNKSLMSECKVLQENSNFLKQDNEALTNRLNQENFVLKKRESDLHKNLKEISKTTTEAIKTKANSEFSNCLEDNQLISSLYKINENLKEKINSLQELHNNENAVRDEKLTDLQKRFRELNEKHQKLQNILQNYEMENITLREWKNRNEAKIKILEESLSDDRTKFITLLQSLKF